MPQNAIGVIRVTICQIAHQQHHLNSRGMCPLRLSLCKRVSMTSVKRLLEILVTSMFDNLFACCLFSMTLMLHSGSSRKGILGLSSCKRASGMVLEFLPKNYVTPACLVRSLQAASFQARN